MGLKETFYGIFRGRAPETPIIEINPIEKQIVFMQDENERLIMEALQNGDELPSETEFAIEENQRTILDLQRSHNSGI